MRPTGHWHYGAIDWAEFKRVLAGDEPMKQGAHEKAHLACRPRLMAPGSARQRGRRRKASRARGGRKDRSGVESMITQPAGTHLAQLNVGHIRYPTDDPRMAEFMGALDSRQRAGRAEPGLRVAAQGRQQQCHQHPGQRRPDFPRQHERVGDARAARALRVEHGAQAHLPEEGQLVRADADAAFRDVVDRGWPSCRRLQRPWRASTT